VRIALASDCVPCPSYPETGLAISPGAYVAHELKAFRPHAIHVATEGPVGLAVRRYCRERGVPFSTSYHRRYPEYLRARWPIPLGLTYAWLRRFHGAAVRTFVSSRTLEVQLAALVASSDVLVFPSLTDTFGLVMLEALACGVPVAAFPVPGPLDVVEPDVTGVLHTDLATAITSALRLDRRTCAQHAARCSWEEATAQFVAGLAPIPTALRARLAVSRSFAMIARKPARRQTSGAGESL
jgi:hypothetical protein